MPDEILEIPNYSMYRKDNHEELKGGILVYAKNHLKISTPKSKKLNNLAAECKEVMLLEIESEEEKTLFGVFYRKPTSTLLNDATIRDLIDASASVYSKVLFCGDFNYPKIDWPNDEINATPFSKESRFITCLENSFLTQHVNCNTRFRGTDKPSCLDLIITENNQNQVNPSICIREPLGKSDHVVMTWDYLMTIKDDSEESQNIPKRNYFKGDYNKLKDLCRSTDWNALLTGNNTSLLSMDIDEALDTLRGKLNEYISETIPLQANKNNKTTLPGLIKQLINI